MLGYISIRATLSTCFARPRVDGILREMIRQGLTKREGPWSPHNAVIAALATALLSEPTPAGALKLAQLARDWRCCGPDDRHRWAPGMGGGREGNMALGDIRLSRVVCMQVDLQRATDWQISQVEAVGNNLCFSRGDYGGPVPERIKRTWCSIPHWVLDQYAVHYGLVRENERHANSLLCSRIEQALRPVPAADRVQHEAAE
jgi:hypothetical protein